MYKFNAHAYFVRAPLVLRGFCESKESESLREEARQREMPESRSRSRKRKAATAASKATSQDAEKYASSQSSAHPPEKEERYVPRFGPSSSAAKRARTAGTGVTFFSCSQPVAPQAPSGSRVRRASDNATTLTTEGTTTTSSSQAGDSTEVTVRANNSRYRTQILFFTTLG